jgi:hypothetical protein
MTSPADPRPRRRPASIVARLLIGLLLVASGLVLAFEILSRKADGIVAERIAAGSFKPDKPKDLWERIAFVTLDPGAKRVEDARNAPHPYLGYYLKPNFSTPPGAAQQCTHNSLGLRNRETTWKKPSGVFRIVTTGGSSVYGQSESNDLAVWSLRLEKMLNEARPDLHVEVINGGCNGWTSFEMLINLELRMMEFEPDLVLVYEAINDMRAALYTAGGPEPMPDNQHWRAPWPVDRPSALERKLEGSRLYLYWRRYSTDYWKRQDLGFYTMTNYDPARNDLYCRWPDGKVPDRGFETYRRNLENMVSVAERGGAKVMFATQALMRWYMTPDMECVDTQLASFERIQAIQREVARARGVALAETGAAIEAEETRVFEATGKHLFKNDVHPFDEGSELIARTVADAVLRSGLLGR